MLGQDRPSLQSVNTTRVPEVGIDDNVVLFEKKYQELFYYKALTAQIWLEGKKPQQITIRTRYSRILNTKYLFTNY